MNWVYNSIEVTSITDLPKEAIGFIYLVKYNDGYMYLGKKNLFSTKTLPKLKTKVREGAKTVRKRRNGKLVEFDEVTTESNWMAYEGSPEYKGSRVVESKEILAIAKNQMELTYLECRELFTHKVLEKDYFLNANILGKFYKGRFYDVS